MNIDNVIAPPREPLERAFSEINKAYFNNSIVAEVEWGVAPREAIVSVDNPSRPLVEGSHQYSQITRAIRWFNEGHASKAYVALKPLAMRGYREALDLIIQIERDRHGDFMKWAKLRGRLDRADRRMPAACLQKSIGKISIHPAIGHGKTPKYVLLYLIYHECLHLVHPSTSDDPHPESLLEKDRLFPKREQARKWLEWQGFPLVEA